MLQKLLIIFINYNSNMIGIGQMYRCSHKMTAYGIEGYQIEKKYQQANKILKEKNRQLEKDDQKRKESKRGHYLEDYAKIHDQIPGPGVYNYDKNNWKSSQKSKKVKPSKKQTYIQEIMMRQAKQNNPAPNQYKLFKDQKQIKAQKKRLSHRKVNVSERFTFLDAVQYQATTTPGVGNYNTQRARSASTLHRYQPMNSRPTSALRKRQKQPDVGSYNPKTVQDHKSFAKKSKRYHQWGRGQRFKSEKMASLGPGAYFVSDGQRVVGRQNGKNVYYQ